MADINWNEKLLQACKSGDTAEFDTCLANKAQAYFQDTETGASALMIAAENGHACLVKKLLEKGAPWNAIDRAGRCAGEYAIDKNHQEIVDILVNAGVRAEMLLGTLEDKIIERGSASNSQYLENPVEYTADGEKLMDTESEAVMMEWEKPLMEIHAKVICGEGGKDVLNVGFGMGIIDTAIQSLKPRSHTIIEAHPDVYKKMIDDGWDKKPGVKILFGRWQDVIDEAGPFDGIFFDTVSLSTLNL